MLLIIMLCISERSSSLSLPALKKAAATRKVELRSDSLATGRFTLPIQELHHPIAWLNVQFHTLRIAFPSKYGAINERLPPSLFRGSNYWPDHGPRGIEGTR